MSKIRQQIDTFYMHLVEYDQSTVMCGGSVTYTFQCTLHTASFVCDIHTVLVDDNMVVIMHICYNHLITQTFSALGLPELNVAA